MLIQIVIRARHNAMPQYSLAESALSENRRNTTVERI